MTWPRCAWCVLLWQNANGGRRSKLRPAQHRVREIVHTTSYTQGGCALAELYRWLPPEAAKLLLVLFLSFLIGLEREEHKLEAGSYSFGGVRTFPLIGLIGYSIAFLSGTQFLPVTIGFLVVGGFL